LQRRELHVGKFADEFRPRRESVSVPIPSGDFQGMDPNHERRDRLQRGEYSSQFLLFIDIHVIIRHSIVYRSISNRFAKRTFTCISTSCFSLYLDRFLPSICLSEWSSTILTSKRKRPADPSRCSWRKIRRNIITPWRKWAIRSL